MKHGEWTDPDPMEDSGNHSHIPRAFETLTKQEFLHAVNLEWDALNRLIHTIDPGLISVPRFLGEWSIKDVIGHISSWEEKCLERIEQMGQGKPVRSMPEEEVPRWNRDHVESKRPHSIEQITKDLNSTHQRLVWELESIPEGELVFKDGIVDWLLDSTTEHYRGHRRAIEAVLFLSESGAKTGEDE